MGPLRRILLFLALTAPVFSQEFSDTLPAGAPTVPCTFTPQSDPATLRVFTGDSTIPFVFACGVRTPGKCTTWELKPGTKDIPETTFLEFNHLQNGWACIYFAGVDGWVPPHRLAALPNEPVVPIGAWLGWYQKSRQTPGKKNDRLLLSQGATPGTIRVSGRGYWYGANDNVHFGQVNAEAKPAGRYLHFVEGEDQNACVLDLTIDPQTHNLSGDDNGKCGALNVRFWGEWVRFTPNGGKPVAAGGN
jgi:hypothetical protein